MLSFDEERIMEEKCMKNGKITIYGKISETCTGTPLNLYQYR